MQLAPGDRPTIEECASHNAFHDDNKCSQESNETEAKTELYKTAGGDNFVSMFSQSNEERDEESPRPQVIEKLEDVQSKSSDENVKRQNMESTADQEYGVKSVVSEPQLKLDFCTFNKKDSFHEMKPPVSCETSVSGSKIKRPVYFPADDEDVTSSSENNHLASYDNKSPKVIFFLSFLIRNADTLCLRCMQENGGSSEEKYGYQLNKSYPDSL